MTVFGFCFVLLHLTGKFKLGTLCQLQHSYFMIHFICPQKNLKSKKYWLNPLGFFIMSDLEIKIVSMHLFKFFMVVYLVWEQKFQLWSIEPYTCLTLISLYQTIQLYYFNNIQPKKVRSHLHEYKTIKINYLPETLPHK